MARKAPLHRLEDAAATLSDLFARPPNAREEALAARLLHDLRRMARESADSLPFWRARCDALIRIVETGDPRYFMRWEPIAATMVARTTPGLARAYWRLRRSAQWRDTWARAVIHPQHGHPPPFLPDPRTNAVSVFHASHLRHYQEVTGHSLLAHDCIAEFGGGYGSMCRMVTRLGFAGRYVIFDIPPILALQRYYLALHGIEAEYAAEAPVVLCHTLKDVAAFLPPAAALISTWALSEMPLELRDRIARFLDDARVRSAFFAYQRRFEGIDNEAYFDGMQERNADKWAWHKTPLDPVDTYLIASPKPSA